jgi:predicted ArsR family transcriptional regulator
VLYKKDKDKVQAEELRFLRSIKGCTRADRIREVHIRAEIQIYNINNILDVKEEKLKQHIEKMTETRIPELILHYQPKGKRQIGRPKGRWNQIKIKIFHFKF